MVPDAGPLLRDSWLVLTVGVTGLVLGAEALSRSFVRAAERCLPWRLVFLVLAPLLVGEFLGLNQLAGSLARGLAWGANSTAPADLAVGPEGWRRSLGGVSGTIGPEAPAAEATSWWLLPGGAWVLGTLFLLGRLAIGQVLLARLRRRLRTPSAPETRERSDRLVRLMGVRVPPLIGESDTLSGPLVFGVVRPTLVLPAHFNQVLTPPQQDAVLVHELRHVQCRDPLWRSLADVLTAVLWWHPGLWWARARLIAEIESAADEASLVLDESGPVGLAEALLSIGRSHFTPHPATLGFGVPDRGPVLSRRVRDLLALRPVSPPAGPSRWLRPGLTVLLAVGGTVLMTGMRPSLVREEHPMKTMNKPIRNSLAWALIAYLAGPGPDITKAAIPLPEQEQGPARSTATPVPVTRAGDRSEAASADFVGLSPVQRKAFDELVQEKVKRNQAFSNRQPHDPAEGMVINKWWNDSLKELFTTEQYAKYVRYWAQGTRVAAVRAATKQGRGELTEVAGSLAKQVEAQPPKAKAPSGPPNFKGMEDDILGQLGLSEVQAEEIAKFYKAQEKVNEEFKALSRTGDGPAIAKRAKEINLELRATMQRIMTKDQYQKYLNLWDERLGVRRGPVAPVGARDPR